MAGPAIIVFTGPFRGRTSIAKAMATWLVAPSLYIQTIIDGLMLQPCNNKTEDVLEELLSPTVGVLHDGEEQQQKLVRIALRVVFSQLPSLASTINNRCGSIVLELPWCSRTLVEMFMKFLNDRQIRINDKRIDRGVIVKCMARGDVSTREWIQTEERLMHRGVFCHPDYYKKGSTDWDSIEKVIVQHLQMISSKFDEQHRGGLMNCTVVSDIEMDPVHDFVGFGVGVASPRLTEERILMPSSFHHAIYHLAFDSYLIGPPGVTTSAREWPKFVTENIFIERLESADCFGDHSFVYTTQLLDKRFNGQLSCRICGKLVTDSASSYSCLYCPVEMHQVCAELVDIQSPSAPADAYDEWFSFLKRCNDGDHTQIDNKLTAACPSCNAMGRPFSLNCKACRLDSFLNYCLLPVIIPHPFLYLEFLAVVITGRTWVTHENCIPCAACGEPIRAGIYYYHRTGGLLSYGFACIALLPREITELEQNNHHGHHHPLKLRDKPYQEYENYICDVCWQERDPRHWHYYCEECDFVCHVYCNCTYDRHRH